MTTETISPPVAVDSRSSAERTRGSGAASWIWIVGPCALAAALVLYQLATRSLWLDEAASVSIASQHGSALWHAIAHDGGNMLGYYLLLHAVIGLFGDGAAVIRLPSALATVATVALVCLIARRMLDRRAVAAAAGTLTAVSLPLVFWGQDARAYAPMLMFICGSFLAFIEVVDGDAGARDASRRRRRWAWVAYVATTVLAAYMSFVALLVVPAQLLAWLYRRDRAKAVLSAAAMIAACCVPLLVLAQRRGSGQLFWVPPPNLKGIGQTLRWLSSAGMPPNFHPTVTTVPALVLSLALLVACGIAAVRARSRSWSTLLVLSWLVVPVLLSIAESLAGQPILLYRNSLVALPAASLLLAWGLMQPRVPRWIGAGAVGALVALRALQLAPSYGISPENWKGAARYVAGARESGRLHRVLSVRRPDAVQLLRARSRARLAGAGAADRALVCDQAVRRAIHAAIGVAPSSDHGLVPAAVAGRKPLRRPQRARRIPQPLRGLHEPARVSEQRVRDHAQRHVRVGQPGPRATVLEQVAPHAYGRSPVPT